MDHIRDWLEGTACPTVDPARDEQIENLARQLAKAMHREGKFFDINDSAPFLMNQAGDDLMLVKERVYELAVRRVLKDFSIDGRDRAGLRWIARTLGLIGGRDRQIELRVGRKVFEEYLMFGMSGGYLDEEELHQVQSMAAGLEIPTRDLLLGYLTDAGEQFLRRLLDGMADNGEITDESWNRLLATAEALGVARQEFLQVLRVHGKAIADHIRSNQAQGRPVLLDLKAVRSLLLLLSQPIN